MSERLTRCEPTAVIGYSDIVGAEVQVISLTMGNGMCWSENGKTTHTIEDVGFRIGMDGKCHTVLYLSDLPGIVFSLKDVVFV